jgi:hypothetical protein
MFGSRTPVDRRSTALSATVKRHLHRRRRPLSSNWAGGVWHRAGAVRSFEAADRLDATSDFGALRAEPLAPYFFFAALRAVFFTAFLAVFFAAVFFAAVLAFGAVFLAAFFVVAFLAMLPS